MPICHTSPVENLNYAWLAPRHESLLDFEKIPEQVAVVQRAGFWGAFQELGDLMSYACESCRKYQDEQDYPSARRHNSYQCAASKRCAEHATCDPDRLAGCWDWHARI